MTGSVSGAQLRAFIERIERLEEEKRTIADDIKEVKAEAKGCGFDVATINAIIKLRKRDAAERAEAQAMLELYMSALGMLPLFEPEQSYSEAKGRGVDAAFVNSILVGGELTDNQESGQPVEVRTEGVAIPPVVGTSDAFPSAVSPAPDESEHDDVGATASSTNSEQREVIDPVAVEASTDKQAAGASRPTNSNSPDTLPVEADSASGAVSSSPASLATHSDDIDLTIPDFLRRTEGGYPKREVVEA